MALRGGLGLLHDSVATLTLTFAARFSYLFSAVCFLCVFRTCHRSGASTCNTAPKLGTSRAAMLWYVSWHAVSGPGVLL